MGIINKFSALGFPGVIQPVYRPEMPKENVQIKTFEVLGLTPKVANNITIAEEIKEVKELLVAHNVEDYRQHGFSLLLLPAVHVAFDDYLEGSDGNVPLKSVE